jgi:hypothetical protein
MPLLTIDEQRVERLRALARMFTQMNRTLSGVWTYCEVENHGDNAPAAWNDGVKMTLNADRIKTLHTQEDIVKVIGVDYHELGHIIVTPRQNSEFTRMLLKREKDESLYGLYRVFNMLEDQRLETFMVGMYPATVDYFVLMFMEYLTGKPEQWEYNHLLAHGRRYLPDDIRKEFRARFKGSDKIAKEGEEIIDAFRFMVIDRNPAERKRAVDLVVRFYHVIRQLRQEKDAQDQGDPSGNAQEHTDKPMVDGKAASTAEQESASEWAEFFESEEQEGAEGGEQGGSEGSGNGSGDIGSGTMSKPSLQKALQAMRKEIIKSEDVQGAIQNTRGILQRGDGKTDNLLPQAGRQYKPIDNDMRLMANRTGKVFEELRADLDPGWHKYQSSGRINIARAMRGDEIDTVFDVWDEGIQDAADIECVILTDYSTSMRSHMDKVSQGMWVLKKSMEEVDAQTTVLGFSDTSIQVYSNEEKVLPDKYLTLGVEGGTDIIGCLEQAIRILGTTTRHHKLLLVLTDGDWNDIYFSGADNATSLQYIDRMNQNGVITGLAYLGRKSGAMDYNERNHCQIGTRITDPKDFVSFARDIVTVVMSKGAKR